MPKERVTDIVERLALPIVEAAGLELVDVEYKGRSQLVSARLHRQARRRRY
ncbi:hypothetical protein GCM10025857_03550 [Alicyclobacillus contaminans]|nr:hypothetical protein GCM10025857_03550 [Alicyclobacillus contaminans]